MLLSPAALAKEKLTATQQVGLKYYKEFSKRIPRTEMDRLREQAMTCAHAVCPTARAEVCGSYRRGAESSGDIDILLTIPGTTAAEGFVGEHKVGEAPKGGKWPGLMRSLHRPAIQHYIGSYSHTWLPNAGDSGARCRENEEYGVRD